MEFLLARTLLKAPLAITMLKNPGLRTTPTVVPLINTQLAAILGHRGVTLRVTRCYRCEEVSMPVPLIIARRPWCPTVHLNFIPRTCLTLGCAHTPALHVPLPLRHPLLKHTLFASLWT